MSFNYNVTFTNVPPSVNKITIINVTEATKASHRSERERKTEHVSVKVLRCTKCGETDTTQWRTGPEGKKTLCNRCGIRYTKWLKFEKFVHERMSIQRLLIQEDPE